MKAVTRVLQAHLADASPEDGLIPLRAGWLEMAVAAQSGAPMAKATWSAHAQVAVELAHGMDVLHVKQALHTEWHTPAARFAEEGMGMHEADIAAETEAGPMARGAHPRRAEYSPKKSVQCVVSPMGPEMH